MSFKLNMRDATKEEYESVNNYIKSISIETNVNFWDLIEDNVEATDKNDK